MEYVSRTAITSSVRWHQHRAARDRTRVSLFGPIHQRSLSYHLKRPSILALTAERPPIGPRLSHEAQDIRSFAQKRNWLPNLSSLCFYFFAIAYSRPRGYLDRTSIFWPW